MEESWCKQWKMKEEENGSDDGRKGIWLKTASLCLVHSLPVILMTCIWLWCHLQPSVTLLGTSNRCCKKNTKKEGNGREKSIQTVKVWGQAETRHRFHPDLTEDFSDWLFVWFLNLSKTGTGWKIGSGCFAPCLCECARVCTLVWQVALELGESDIVSWRAGAPAPCQEIASPRKLSYMS